ncbi:unnamed protein product [Penicillium egyptiacum]|uniref:Ubiquitin-like domain-containing protein n=1 Tax=Penicillium egyptiacum TaxID=1303716 RepID=A0A9W4K913_9EURO|nr:unnamed protein product [Penicillium egyptiacum]
MEGLNRTEPKQEQQQQNFVSDSSPDTLPQLELELQPKDCNMARLREASPMSRIASDYDRLYSFQSGLEQLQDTLDTPISRWKREVDPSQEMPHHYAPLGGPDFSVEETAVEDRPERTGNVSRGASPITESNFDQQAAFSERPVGEQEHHEMMTTTAPAASPSTTKISSVVIQCLKDLNRLVSEDLSSFASEVPPALWKDELGRLRVWAANIGAHQAGQLSLDHRLRDASHIKNQTLRVLQRLQRTTADINDVLHHSTEDDDFSDLSEDEDDDEHRTEIQSVYHALRDTINNLYQMSMVIRQPAQHDRLLGTKRSDAVFFEHFDWLHVSSKYPQAGEDILKRLGLAISHRRAVMRYRERHRTKLGQGLSQVMEDQPDGQSAKLSETVATEFVEALPAEKSDLEFLTVASQTSYAQTILNGAEGTVLPSPPKEAADGAPFECPYCFVIITIANRRAWARHVFNDLMPYLCIFPNCPTPHRLYESRRGWFSHLQSQHSVSESPGVYVDCALCLSSVPSGKQLERHVGRHLEELALFALPRSEEDDNEGEIPSDADSDSHDSVVEGQCPECGLVFHDLRAHAMTHNQSERTEKCPIVTCEYHIRGFARKYDMIRHALVHYKGVMVCPFCPGPGTPREKSFNRADVFKRHLVAVHGVMHMQPNQPDHRPNPSTKMGTNLTSDSTGNCSICNETFADAQDFYKHLDNCVMLKVMQEDPSESINHMHLANVNGDEETNKTPQHASPGADDPVDQADDKYSRIHRRLSQIPPYTPSAYAQQLLNEEIDAAIPPSGVKSAASDEGSDTSHHLLSAEDPTPPYYSNYWNDHGLTSERDPQSARENNLPGESNLEVHKPAISHTLDYLEQPPSTQPMHWDRQWDADNNETNESEPDIIVIKHRGATHPLRFRPYAINNGMVTVGMLRQEAGRIGATSPDLVMLLYKGKILRDDNQTCKAEGLRHNSEVLFVVSSRGSATASRKEDDKNVTFTLNGSQIRFTSEAVAGKTISIRAGDTGAVRLNTGGPQPSTQHVNGTSSDYTGGSSLRELEDGVRRGREDRRSERSSRREMQSAYRTYLGTQSDSSHYERDNVSVSSRGQYKGNKDKKKKAGHMSPPHVETETASLPFPPSRHPSPAPPSNSLLSPPNLKTMPTAMEKVSALTAYFEGHILPLCDGYIAQPPGNIETRDFEHKKLSEMVLRQVMLPVDGIHPEGDVNVRNARRALVKQAHSVLRHLDAAARA